MSKHWSHLMREDDFFRELEDPGTHCNVTYQENMLSAHQQVFIYAPRIQESGRIPEVMRCLLLARSAPSPCPKPGLTV